MRFPSLNSSFRRILLKLLYTICFFWITNWLLNSWPYYPRNSFKAGEALRICAKRWTKRSFSWTEDKSFFMNFPKENKSWELWTQSHVCARWHNLSFPWCGSHWLLISMLVSRDWRFFGWVVNHHWLLVNRYCPELQIQVEDNLSHSAQLRTLWHLTRFS